MSKQVNQHLRGLVTDIMDAAFDPEVCGFGTEQQLADKARLCLGTINKLRRGITTEPRYTTIYKLAKAVKMDMVLCNEAMLAAAQHAATSPVIVKHKKRKKKQGNAGR